MGDDWSRDRLTGCVGCLFVCVSAWAIVTVVAVVVWKTLA